MSGSGPRWGQQWEPKGVRRLSFGGDPTVAVLDGGYAPPPIPPDFRPPPTNLQRVLIEEPTEGWWNQEGAFGYKHSGLVPPTEGEIIALTEQLHLPGPPAPWWIQWFRYNRGLATEASANGNFELRGRITYGVGGAQNIIEVDLIQGIQFPLVCNSIKVDLVTYNPLGTGPSADPYEAGECVAGAVFGKGAGGGALPPSWSTPSEVAIGAGVVLETPIPDFARSLCLHTTVSDPAAAALLTATIGFICSGVPIKVVAVSQLYAELTSERGIAIPAGTNQISLTVPAAAAGERFAFQFFLAL